MSFLGFGKKKKVVDWASDYHEQEAEKAAAMKQIKEQQNTSETTPFSVFDSPAATSNVSSSDDFESAATPEERKKRLAKRILNLSERIEDLSNQIYHLQQRIELLEKKLDVKSSGY